MPTLYDDVNEIFQNDMGVSNIRTYVVDGQKYHDDKVFDAALFIVADNWRENACG